MDTTTKTVQGVTCLAGKVLLSHPAMRGGIFRRTAVFILSQGSNGAMGIILNRPTGRLVSEAAPAFAYTPLATIPLYVGGPVQPESLMFAAWYGGGDGGYQIKCGLSREEAADLLSSMPDARLRCFHGHAGWAPGQLEKECHASNWAPAPLDFSILNSKEGVQLWQKFLKEYHPFLHLLAQGPDDPSKN
ncbi:MAG: YqgE/AlgH family protein [Puniceicoccales bacterium]|jgi:putative transcriptional regulator|nr:YqgE/AlgH family protein [Puniceicoccales bacterium]